MKSVNWRLIKLILIGGEIFKFQKLCKVCHDFSESVDEIILYTYGSWLVWKLNHHHFVSFNISKQVINIRFSSRRGDNIQLKLDIYYCEILYIMRRQDQHDFLFKVSTLYASVDKYSNRIRSYLHIFIRLIIMP